MKYRFREIWKTVVIDGVEHPRYQVSNLGRVKNIDWYGTGKENLCNIFQRENKYLSVMIDKKMFFVHRLVGEAFIPNPQKKLFIDHIDTNRKNNSVWNLRWTTRLENNNNPITRKKKSENNAKTMLGKFGAEHPNAKELVQLTLCGKFVKKWSCAAEVEREIGISQSNITKCCRFIKNYKSAGGYRWMYYSDYIKSLRQKSLSEIKPLF